jgi:membrane protein implicated in regulation of membrane protease activity
VGRVPLSIILMVLMLTWGMIGVFSNMVLWEKYHDEMLLVAVSIPLAFVGSVLSSRLMTAAMVRWFPTHETYVQRRHELLGAVGEVILPIDSNFGMAAVRDEYHDLFHIACRVRSDQPALEKGTKVKLVGFNGKQNIYYVMQYDPAVASRTA